MIATARRRSLLPLPGIEPRPGAIGVSHAIYDFDCLWSLHCGLKRQQAAKVAAA